MSYPERRDRLAESLRLQRGGDIRLGKTTSNLFRERQAQDTTLDVSGFQHVLSVDSETRIIETEGMVTYEALTDAALTHSLMPAVVPQLKSITIGGAVGGIGIESSSFRFGLPHETVLEMDVLLGSGEIICCTPDNEHRDLFYGLANSYGTL
ncbi:MAG TPA: FAD-linked oxidase, partial [Gammaproteobacteria bacterium]|nr:FAD-linked oxidase [Gammaproteobacteria bacterium]